MAQRLPFYVIILLFTLFVVVASRPARSKATQVKIEALPTLKHFDPKKASYERRTEQSSDGAGRGHHGSPKLPDKPQPSMHHYRY